MENKEILQRLRGIVNKSARKVDSEDREFLRQMSEKFSVKIGNKGCVKCWHELAMKCYIIVNELQPAEQSDRKFILKPGVDLIFGTTRVNEATLTDELAREIISRGFNVKYFAKYEDNKPD